MFFLFVQEDFFPLTANSPIDICFMIFLPHHDTDLHRERRAKGEKAAFP